MGLYLIVGGVLIAFGSFVFAALNMAGMMKGDFDSGFQRHIYSMIGLATGGLVAIIGIIVFVADLLSAV
jgi:hypothetical protein